MHACTDETQQLTDCAEDSTRAADQASASQMFVNKPQLLPPLTLCPDHHLCSSITLTSSGFVDLFFGKKQRLAEALQKDISF